MQPSTIQEHIESYLKDNPDKSAREIRRYLISIDSEVTKEVTKKQINKILYSLSGKIFEKEGDLPPRWKLIPQEIDETEETKEPQETEEPQNTEETE